MAKIGLCTSFENHRRVRDWGFDYIEIPVREYAHLEIQKVREMRKRLDGEGVPCPAGNFFYAADLRLTGESVDFSKIHAYIDRALENAAELGCSVLVVGCGPQRQAPLHFPRGKAVKQFGEHLQYAQPLARRLGLTLTIENIWDGDSNILFTARDCYKLMQEIDLPGIRMMVDFIHMRRQGEDFDILDSIGPDLKHVHIGNSYTARCPLARGEDAYEPFLERLRAIRYCGSFTVETQSFDHAAESAAFLRAILSEAGF